MPVRVLCPSLTLARKPTTAAGGGPRPRKIFRCLGEAKSSKKGSGRTSERGRTAFVFSISERSAGISWLRLVAAAGPVAVAEPDVAAAPDGPPGGLAAAAEPVEGAARPFGAAEALALPSGAPDAAVVRPDVAAPLVVFEASAEPAARISEALQPVWLAAVAAEPRLAFAPFPERPAWLPELEPNRRLSVDPPEMLAHSSLVDLAGRVLRSDSAQPERVPSRLPVQEVPPSRPGPAMHWPSAKLLPEAAH
jgi:hypothetical protein